MERGRSSRRWGWIIVGVLVAQAAVVLTMVTVAARDPSFAVEPDYYAKAVQWDDEARARAHARALGWTAEASLKGGMLTVVVRDRAGAALEGAAVDAEYFHQARAAARTRVVLGASGEGRYAAPVEASRAGRYEVRVDVSRCGDRVSLVTTAWAGADGPDTGVHP